MRISDWSSDVCSSDLLHLHRCRHIMVAVTYNGETIDRKFAPGATIARVKRWAAERKFGMTEEEAGEHVLQIAGTHERPAPGPHIGVLANRKTCGLAFALAPGERVNGANEHRRVTGPHTPPPNNSK